MTAADLDAMDPPARLGLAGPVTLGAAGAVLLVGVLGVWAATARIGGAVVASGVVTAADRAQQVQPLEGGLVHSIEVANGDQVEAGDVLVTLDDTVTRTNLGIAQSRLAEALTLEARLAAEEQGLPEPVFRWPDLPVALPDTSRQEAAQMRLFEARTALTEGGRARLAERLAEARTRRESIDAQLAAVRDQLALLNADRERLVGLVEEGLARSTELSELDRRISEATGRDASLVAERDGIAASMRDAELETLQLERSRAEEAGSDRREAAARIDELVLEIATREAELARMVLRAPVAGTVHELQVSTVGGVVAAGATVLKIVPRDGGFTYEVRVDPRSIDQVRPGQTGEIQFAGLDPTAVPKIPVVVDQVSADAVTDPKTGASYYTATLAVADADLAALGEVELLPGMPIEAYLGTAERSVLEYLVHPLRARLQRTFREP